MLINSPNISGSLNVSGNTVITGSLTTSIAALNTPATTFLTSNNGTIRSRTAAQTLSDIGAQASGSYLTISSATGSYVPYTGATGTVNLGYNPLVASRIRIDGNAPTAGSHLGFKQATSVDTGDGGYTSISTFGTNTMTFVFAQPTGFKRFSFNVFGITQDVSGGRVYSMPDESGTLALTSNLGSYLPLTGGGAITGSLIVTGGITGNVTGSATTASYVEYSNVANKPTLLSGSVQIRDFGIFATTGSNQFNGNQAITGSLTTTGTIVAQTLNVQQVTSSIVYSSGSNIFGNSVSNTQQFTGSLQVSGSSHNILGNIGIGPTGTPSAELQVGKSSDVTIAMSNSSSVTSGPRGSIAWYNSSVSSVATIRAAAVTDNVGTELQFFTRPAAGSLTQSMTLDANGRLGIGTTSQRGVLDISSGLRTGTLSGLFIGADSDTTAGTRTNNTRKIGMIASPHYENASSSVFGISMDNQASNNFIYIGGGYSGYNAATAIAFSTGGTTTTETGTERMRINSSGSVGIGTPSPSSLLEVAGGGVFSLQLSGNLTDATRKFAFIQGKHYTNSEEPIAMIGIDSQASVSTLYIGGGLTSGLNAATEISFQTGATNTTLTGTQRMHIASGGLITVTGTGAGQTSEGIFFKRTSNLAQGGYISGNGGALNIVATNEYSSANGTIYFQRYNGTTTTPSMIIDGNGVVLINNTYASPYGVLNTYKLPVNSTYVDQIVVQGTGNYPSLRLGTYDAYDGVIATTGNDLRILAGLDVYSENHSIRFYTSFNGGTGGAQAYERMRIEYNGNVWISTTTSISSVFALEVGNGSSDRRILCNTNSSYALSVSRSSNRIFYLGADTSGNGIFSNGSGIAVGNINESTGVYTATSDINKKKDFEESTIGLNAILGLKPTLYRMKSEDETTNKHLGFIAQEVEKFIPQAYSETGGDDDKFIGLNYNPIVAALVKAIQELKAENDTLKSRIDTLEQA